MCVCAAATQKLDKMFFPFFGQDEGERSNQCRGSEGRELRERGEGGCERREEEG